MEEVEEEDEEGEEEEEEKKDEGAKISRGDIRSRNKKVLAARAEKAKAMAEAKRRKAIWKEKQRQIAAATNIQRIVRGFMGRYEASKHWKAGVIKWFIEECKALGKMASVLQTFRARKRILEKEMADRAREAERKMMDMVSLRYGLVKNTVDTVKYYSAGAEIHAEAGKAVLDEACPELSRIQRERLVVENQLKVKLIERGAEMGLFGHDDLGDAAYIVKARESTKDVREKREKIEESMVNLRDVRTQWRERTQQSTRKLKQALRANVAARQHAAEKSKDTYLEQHYKLPAKISMWYEQTDDMVYGNIPMGVSAQKRDTVEMTKGMWRNEEGWGSEEHEVKQVDTNTKTIRNSPGRTSRTLMSMCQGGETLSRPFLSSKKAMVALNATAKAREDETLKSQQWFADLTDELYKYAMTRGALAALEVNRNHDGTGNNESGVPLGLLRFVLCIAQSLREGVDFAYTGQRGDAHEQATLKSLALDIVCSCVLPAELSLPIAVSIVRQFTRVVGVLDPELYHHLSKVYDSTVDLRGWR